MCWQSVVKDATTHAIDAAKDAGPAVASVGVVTIGGITIGVPSFLVGLSQAVIVVFFTLRGVDRRLRERDKERDIEVKEMQGAIATLSGRFEASCANPMNQRRRASDHAPVCPADPAWVE